PVKKCICCCLSHQNPDTYLLIFCSVLSSVTCIIMQKNGAGLQSASSCFWDNTTDGSCTVRWENKHLYCIVSVFGLAI
uniref:Dynein, light chain, Tctex-type 1 n=1 Tax=Cyprinus carpio TaxID=7962 RepID=A0A8C1Q1S2_CYPCA